MKAAPMIAQACAGLLVIGCSCSAAVAMASAASAPQLTLVNTDTSEPFPFATLLVGNVAYHVTEGDVINGLHVRRITPGHVALSDNEVLVATQPDLDIENHQVANEKFPDRRPL
jgi:hypothetical protein